MKRKDLKRKANKAKQLLAGHFDDFDFDLAGLGDVSFEIEELIQNHEDDLEAILNELERDMVRFSRETISLEENDLLYNAGISEAEKKAWVHYQQTERGIPMTGWEKYHIKNDQKEIDALVMDGALFYHEGKYLPYPIYTWGNIYEREDELENNRAYIVSHYSEAVYQNHKAVLEKAKPPMLHIDDEDETRRPVISAISKIAYNPKIFSISEIRPEYSQVEEVEMYDKRGNRLKKQKRIELKFDGEKRYSLQEVFSKYLYTLGARDFINSDAYSVQQYYLIGAPISGQDRDLTAAEKAQIKQSARENGERLFSIFLREVLTYPDIEKLNRSWNRKYNGWSDLQYASVPIGLETSANFLGHGFAIRPEKREGIAYMSAVGSGIIAYDVGVGKTITALLELANALQSGKAHRALLIVPNPTYKNWIKEGFGGMDDETGEQFNGLLSGTGITINEWYNLGTDVVKRLDKTGTLNKPVAEKSITILTYEGFKNLGFSDEVGMSFINEFIEIMEQNAVDPDEAGTAASLGSLGARSKRDESKSKEQYLELVGLGAKQNTVADVDTLGFDYIVIDEAHRCKNIFEGVKADENTGNKNYLLSGSQSTTGIKAFFICNYIQRIAAPKKGNVMLLTATPFTNSPLEVYSMMSLVGYDHMLQSGLYNINDFFKMFVKPEPEYVVKYDGSVTVKDTIKGYTNRLVLQKLIFTKINYKSGDELNPPLQRPIKINIPLMYQTNSAGHTSRLPAEKQILSYLEMNEEQKNNQFEINTRLKNITRENFTDLLKYMNASQDNALSPFLYKLGANRAAPTSAKEFVESSPKIKYACDCIATIKEYHESRNQHVSGQVIYADRGVEYFHLIKQYLIETVGFKKQVMFEGKKLSEVMIIAGGDGKENVDKEVIKEAFLAGIVKVIIGSSTIREGINLQTYGTVIYSLRPDWNPTDHRQLEGRIHRQKNKYGFVRIVMPLVADSMDVFMFQKLEEKTSRINDIFYREGSSNMLDLSSLDPGEIKYALISDIGSLAMIDFGIEHEKASKAVANAAEDFNAIKELESEISRFETARGKIITELAEGIEKIEKWIRAHQEQAKDDKEVKKLIERAQKIWKALSEILASPKDEDLAGCKMRADNWNSIAGYSWDYRMSTWVFDGYREMFSNLRKKERYILKPLGLNLESPVEVMKEMVESKNGNVRKDFLADFGINEDGVYVEMSNDQVAKVAKLENPPRRYREIYEYIETKKRELAIEGKPVSVRVKEFERLNYLLDYSMKEIDPMVHVIPEPGQAAAKSLQCPPIDREGKRRIDTEAVDQIQECIAASPSTKGMYTDKDGNYTPDRLQLHTDIIADFKQGVPCVRQDKPICILTGGPPGSGKTTFLKKFAPWISSGKLYHVDADEVRAKLPEYEGWNSANTHEETRDVVFKLLDEIGTPCVHDMIYDGTMNKAANYKPLIAKLKELGYIVFVIYIEVPKEVSMKRALERYQRSGRFVPPQVINDVYSKGLEAFQEVIKQADGHIQVDGITGKVKSRSGFQLPKERNYMEEDSFDPGMEPGKTAFERIASQSRTAIKPNMKILKLKAKAAKAKLLLMNL